MLNAKPISLFQSDYNSKKGEKKGKKSKGGETEPNMQFFEVQQIIFCNTSTQNVIMMAFVLASGGF